MWSIFFHFSTESLGIEPGCPEANVYITRMVKDSENQTAILETWILYGYFSVGLSILELFAEETQSLFNA